MYSRVPIEWRSSWIKTSRVKIVRSQYQRTKAEKEDELDFSHLEGQSVDDMTDAVLAPVGIDYISSPSKT